MHTSRQMWRMHMFFGFPPKHIFLNRKATLMWSQALYEFLPGCSDTTLSHQGTKRVKAERDKVTLVMAST